MIDKEAQIAEALRMIEEVSTSMPLLMKGQLAILTRSLKIMEESLLLASEHTTNGAALLASPVKALNKILDQFHKDVGHCVHHQKKWLRRTVII